MSGPTRVVFDPTKVIDNLSDVSGRVQHNEAAIDIIDVSLAAHYQLVTGNQGAIHDVSGRVQHNEAAIEVIDMSLGAHYQLVTDNQGAIHDVSSRVQHNEASIEVIDVSLAAHYQLVTGNQGAIHDVSSRVQHNEAAIDIIDVSLAAHYDLIMNNQDTISNITSISDKTTFFTDNPNGLVEMPALNVATTLWQPFGGDILNVQGLKSNPDTPGFQYYGRSTALSDDAQFLAVSAWRTNEISNNVVDIYQYSDISNIWQKIQRIESNTISEILKHNGFYLKFNTLSNNTIRLFVGDIKQIDENDDQYRDGYVTMYELSGNEFIQKARQESDENARWSVYVDQKQDSYIVIGSPTDDNSYKIRKINIYTPDFSTKVLTLIVPKSFGYYCPLNVEIDQDSNYIYFMQYSPSSTSTETQDLYIYNIKDYIDNPPSEEITLNEEDNLAKQFKSIPNQANNSISETSIMGVSVSNNGEYIVVGKSYLQADIYHLDKETGEVDLVYQIYPPSNTGDQGEFAENVSMSGDGKRIAVFYHGTIPYTGGVIIYETQDYQEWHQIGNNIVGDDYQDGVFQNRNNNRISLSADGQVVAIGYPFAETPETRVDAGFARTYRLTDNTSIMRVDRDGVTFNGPLELDVLHVKDTIKFTNNNNIHMGYLAGDAAKSGSNNIRLGFNAGHDAVNTSNSVAIGSDAGKYGHSSNAVAIGRNAGNKDQRANSVAIGSYAGYQDQSGNSVAIGTQAGFNQQQQNAIAIGNNAGKWNLGDSSIVIGKNAGYHMLLDSAYPDNKDNILIGSNCGTSPITPDNIAANINNCIYIGRNINPLSSREITTNEIILGNDISSNMLGRGTNVMILGNDELQRIIIPSYQNLKTNTPQYDGQLYDGQLYIDADNNLKVFESPVITSESFVGNWQIAEEIGSLRVTNVNRETIYWQSNIYTITERQALYNDIYALNADDTFENQHDGETWLEPFQGVSGEGTGAPVSPHDGIITGVWEYNGNDRTLKINGKGNYLGLPKAVNGSELTNPNDAPDSITYTVISVTNSRLEIEIESGNVLWKFVLTKRSY